MSQQKIRVSSIAAGSFFIVVAVSALLGQFNDTRQVTSVFPVLLVVVGVAVIAGAIIKLLQRDP